MYKPQNPAYGRVLWFIAYALPPRKDNLSSQLQGETFAVGILA